MTEKAPIKHTEPNKEKGVVLSWPEKIALHARLLISQNAINPENTNLVQVDKTQLSTLEARDYTVFNKSSLASREKYYEKSTDLNTEKDKWSDDFVKKISSSTNFFTQTDDGKRWTHLLSAFGIHTESITKENVDTFYKKYLQGDEKNGQIKLFVKEVVDYHRDTKGRVALDRLDKNTDVINWMAHTFGDEAIVEMVAELALAESRLITEKDIFVQAINAPDQANTQISRVNTLLPLEKSTLARIWQLVKPFTLPEQPPKINTEPKEPTPKKPPVNDPKKIEPPPKEIEPSSPEPNAVFTNETKELLIKCGINPDHVNPIPMGKGANHTVFSYSIPGQEKQVVKIPNPKSVGTLTKGMIEEDANIATVVKAFPRYSIPTSVKKDPNSDQYCIVQQAVEGVPLTQLNCTPELKKQLLYILSLNHRLIETQQISLDYVGMPGFFTWINRQFKRHGPFEVSNILINKQGQLQIIDYDIFDFNHGSSIRHKIASKVGFIANRFLMHHYFGVDIQSPTKTHTLPLVPENT